MSKQRKITPNAADGGDAAAAWQRWFDENVAGHWSDEDVKSLLDGRQTCVLAPIPMLLWCPECGERHIDVGEFATRPHHTHACQGCGHVWRPAIEPTVGVQFLPGFKNP